MPAPSTKEDLIKRALNLAYVVSLSDTQDPRIEHSDIEEAREIVEALVTLGIDATAPGGSST